MVKMKPFHKLNPLRQPVKQRVLALLRKPTLFTESEVDRAVDQNLYLTVADVALGLRHPEAFCKRCGECCRVSRRVVLEPPDVVRLAFFLRMSISDFLVRYAKFEGDEAYLRRARGACCFLTKDNLCSVYKARPAVCRQFPCAQIDKGVLHGVDIKCGFLVELLAWRAVSHLLASRMPARLKREMKTVAEAIESKVKPSTDSFEDLLDASWKAWELLEERLRRAKNGPL